MALHLCRKSFIPAAKHSYPKFPSSCYHLAFSLSFSSASKQETVTSIADHLIHYHEFSPETVSKISSALTHLNSCKQADLTIKYLKDFGFSNSHLDEMVRRMPKILAARLDTTIKPKIQFLQQLGVSPCDIVELISADPWVLHRDIANQLGPSFQALRSFLGSDADVLKVLKLSGEFLKYNLQKTMVPSIQLMKNSGISQPQITQCLLTFPRLFLSKPVKIEDYMKRVDKMGFDRNSKMFVHAIRVMSSMSEESWESKLKLFRSLGFSEEDLSIMFQKMPQVFGVSERKIKEISDILCSAGKNTLLIEHPDLILYSPKLTILPRIEVMDLLVSKKLVKRRPSLRSLCKLSERQFYSKYVQPYSDVVGGIYLTGQG